MAVVVNQYLLKLSGELLLSLSSNPGSWQYHLYVNLYAPTYQDTTASYVECSLPGYSPLALIPSEWVGPELVGPVAQWQYPTITWVFDPYVTAQQTIFGYYVTDATGGVVFSELFPAPYPVPPSGGELPVQPFWTNEQCPQTL
jgi:hypothetical protein